MTVYTFDATPDGLLTAVFDAYALRQQPDELVRQGQVLPMFCEQVHAVATADDKAQRVWAGLERRLSPRGLQVITYSWLSELPQLDTPLFHYIYKVFQQPLSAPSPERNFSDADVLYVTNVARRVAHESLHMKQFIRFQKAKDGTYLAVVAPDHNVLPLAVDHFGDRFRDQPWLIFDARRRYGYYFNPAATEPQNPQPRTKEKPTPIRITFEDDTHLPFDLQTGKLDPALLSDNDQLMQDLWRTYFKAICIRERLNPKKQLQDMPRRYWKYMTEKN